VSPSITGGVRYNSRAFGENEHPEHGAADGAFFREMEAAIESLTDRSMESGSLDGYFALLGEDQ